MKISQVDLCSLVVEVAKTKFGQEIFSRRALMDKVEEVVRERGIWENKDDEPSGSRGKKSKGQEKIDYLFTPLKINKHLTHVGTDQWKVSDSEVELDGNLASVSEGIYTNGPDFLRLRNHKLMDKRKSKDKYTCQVCGFYLKVGNSHVIDCHHLMPIAEGERETTLDDLISLCPTCHSIAHIHGIKPLTIEEIKEIRGKK